MKKIILEVKDLRVYFREDKWINRAIDGINFSIKEDEIVGLVGESGSGKTITALSLIGLLPHRAIVESGSINFEGIDLLKQGREFLADIRGCKIGMVFQEPFTSLNPVLSIGEQIAEIFVVHKSLSASESERNAKLLLENLEIKDPERVYHSYPHQLSGGQRQRVGVAMALALRPKLLVADEPTTALDVTIQSEILKLLLRLKDELRMSVLFITHDLGIINIVADRVIVMKNGRIVERGRKDDILCSPTHPYTKRLLNAVPRIEKGLMPKEDTETFIKIDSLTKSFLTQKGLWRKKTGKIKAVDGVSLDIKRAETLGLVGESASGKSTLGRLLLGLLKPDSGRILIDGKDLDEYLKKTPRFIRKLMQIVFQDPFSSLDPHLKMKDIVLEGPVVLGVDRDKREALFRDIVRKVGLEYKDCNKYPHQFSGGERQRIAIARALAVEPEFLVLDEPVSSLDVSIQADILKLLRILQEDMKLTYLFISHDLRVISLMANNIAVMQNGKIVEYGSKSEVFNNPTHPYTKRLLVALPAINL